jgi:hypothetical protein
VYLKVFVPAAGYWNCVDFYWLENAGGNLSYKNTRIHFTDGYRNLYSGINYLLITGREPKRKAVLNLMCDLPG